MFILYTADLEDAVAAHDVRLHAYADDTQLYLKCQAQEATAAAHTHSFWLAVWLSGNTLASINVVALRQTRLVLGWVTICGRVNHLGM